MARHQFAVLALAAVAVLSSFWLLLDVVRGYSNMQTTFGVEAFEDRFRALRSALPPRATVAYASDNPTDSQTSLGEFYLTQYTLAPAIVSGSAPSKGSLVVVNFHTPTPDMKKVQDLHLELVQNFGGGVLLCRQN